MPIPNFDHNNVLPPHLGNPTIRTDISPYPCSILELCHRFSTSNQRIQILTNFVAFRQRMNAMNIVKGFQWLDGSFLEDIEAAENRPPQDLDVVTFYGGFTIAEQTNFKVTFPEFTIPSLAKNNYLLDHYAVDYCYSPDVTVEQTRYWLQLFTHNRLGVWKGILRLPLNTTIDDQQALDYLNSL
jgi:hypothetical protein